MKGAAEQFIENTTMRLHSLVFHDGSVYRVIRNCSQEPASTSR